MKKEERLKLEELSTKAFGSKSRYRKVMEKGELISGTSTDKKGKSIQVRTFERPNLEQMITIMEDTIRDKEEAAKKDAELKAQEKQNE